MKAVRLVAAILVIIGGLNWGLFGALHIDLVAATLGPFSAISRVVYLLVGLAALYQAVTFRRSRKRRRVRIPVE